MEKNNLEYYLSLKCSFKVEIISEEDGGGCVITYHDLPGCMSDGETIEETLSKESALLLSALSGGLFLCSIV